MAYKLITESYKNNLKYNNEFIPNYDDPNVFGPYIWFVLHNSSSRYPINPSNEDKTNMKNLLKSIYLLIPCNICRNHFNSFLKKGNLDVITSTRNILFMFLFDLHNIINLKNNKPLMTIQEAKHRYYRKN